MIASINELPPSERHGKNRDVIIELNDTFSARGKGFFSVGPEACGEACYLGAQRRSKAAPLSERHRSRTEIADEPVHSMMRTVLFPGGSHPHGYRCDTDGENRQNGLRGSLPFSRLSARALPALPTVLNNPAFEPFACRRRHFAALSLNAAIDHEVSLGINQRACNKEGRERNQQQDSLHAIPPSLLAEQQSRACFYLTWFPLSRQKNEKAYSQLIPEPHC